MRQEQTLANEVNEESVTNASNDGEWIDKIKASFEVAYIHEFTDKINMEDKEDNDAKKEEANRSAASLPRKARPKTKQEKNNKELHNLKSDLGTFGEIIVK